MEAREPTSRRGPGIGTLVLVLFVGLVAWLLYPMVRHNVLLARFERGVRAVPLPPGTSVVATTSRFGLLSGNGNHCDYLAVSLLSSTLPREGLQAHFAGRTARAAEHGGEVELRVVPLGDAAHPDDLRFYAGFDARTEFHRELSGAPAGGLFLLYAMDQYSADMDFRCH